MTPERRAEFTKILLARLVPALSKKPSEHSEQWEKINDDIMDLMRKFGPDGHVDGSEEMTDYIMSLLGKEMENDS